MGLLAHYMAVGKRTGMQQWFQNQSLGTKFTLIMVAVFVVGMVVGGFLLYRVAQSRAQDEMTNRGEALLETMNAVRTYTSLQVNPLLADRLETDEQFVSETVPGYSARTVFENLRQDERYTDFLYKEATLNPTNPRDQADAFETDLVNEFITDSDLEELTGFRDMDGTNVFYIARPIAIEDESCLRCHSTPDAAPDSLLASYGDQGGFGWQLGEIVGAQVIYVPARGVFADAELIFAVGMLSFGLIFGVGIVLINRILNPLLVKPVESLSAYADDLREDAESSRGIPNISGLIARGDELGSLARTFEQMARDVRKREAKLKRELKQLQIEIDHDKREREVNRIADSDYFRNLQERAAALRKQMKNRR